MEKNMRELKNLIDKRKAFLEEIQKQIEIRENDIPVMTAFVKECHRHMHDMADGNITEATKEFLKKLDNIVESL